ncbi:MAG: hypothetical protein IPM29_09365 [Planctomycetes bacterium]|nr:hypothetical protein [Planctomycetota bacterium]
MVADTFRGALGSQPRQLHVIGDRAAVVADDGQGTHLFMLDRTELDWRRSPTNGNYYRLTDPLTWFDAKHQARNWGGHLVAVGDQAESDWLWATFGPLDLWIGLEDHDRNGVFEWVSGEPFQFTNWCPGEPNHASPNETAVHMANYPGFCLGGWNDQDPLDQYRGIVERTAAPDAVESLGIGCSIAYANGLCTLVHVSGRPALGHQTEFELDLNAWLPSISDGIIVLGLDCQAYGTLPLPLSLEPFGWGENCRLYIDIVDAIPIALDAWGRGGFDMAIPAFQALVGNQFFLQGLVLWADPYSSISHRTSSNALRVTIQP